MASVIGCDDVLVVLSRREFEALGLLLGRMTTDEKAAFVGDKGATILRQIFVDFGDE